MCGSRKSNCKMTLSFTYTHLRKQLCVWDFLKASKRLHTTIRNSSVRKIQERDPFWGCVPNSHQKTEIHAQSEENSTQQQSEN